MVVKSVAAAEVVAAAVVAVARKAVELMLAVPLPVWQAAMLAHVWEMAHA